MWIEREISNKIIELSRLFPALILTGARQTGKTSRSFGGYFRSIATSVWTYV
jgi:predicted AAA+ superfamily ATPase